MVDYGQLSEMVFSDKDDYMVPFAVYRKNNEANELDYDLLIVRDWEDVLPKGGRLVSINGKDAHELYDVAYEYACIEGSAASARDMVAATLYGYINGLYNPADSVNYFQVIPPGKETADPEKKQLKPLRCVVTKRRNTKKSAHKETSSTSINGLRPITMIRFLWLC